MDKVPSTRYPRSLMSVALLFTVTPLFAQTTPAPKAATPAPAPAAKPDAKPVAPAVVPTTTASAAEEETILLTPFEVTAAKADEYESNVTNSITGTSTQLSKVPLTIESYNKKMMDDLGFTDMQSLFLNFSGLGINATTVGGDTVGALAGDGGLIGIGKIRGISGGEGKRDGIVSAVYALQEGFTTDKVELIKGPQSLLYGSAAVGGITNVVTKAAQLGKTFGSLSMVNDEYGSYRVLADYNHATGSKFAARAIGVREERRFDRDNLELESKGHYIGLALRPIRALTIRGVFQQYERHEIYSDPQVANLTMPGDPRNNFPLSVLVAQNRAGDLLNGQLNWENVASLWGDNIARLTDSRYYQISADARLNKYLSAQVRFADESVDQLERQNSDPQHLAPPNTGFNHNNALPAGSAYGPLPGFEQQRINKWTVGNRASHQERTVTQKGYRVSLNADFPITRFTENNLIVGGDSRRSKNELWRRRYWLIDANGDFVRNPAALANQIFRVQSPINRWSVEDGNLDGIYNYRNSGTYITGQDGRVYKAARENVVGGLPATPGNPTGLSEASATGIAPNVTWTRTLENAYFATLFTNWFDGKFDTMAGARQDRFYRNIYATGDRIGPDKEISKNLGFVYHIHSHFSLYYGYSDSYKAVNTTQSTYYNQPLPSGRGSGEEAGIKIHWPNSKITGAATVFRGEAANESSTIPGTQDAVDPLSNINNSRGGGPNFLFDRTTQGLELSVNAKITPRWTVRASANWHDGVDGTDVSLPRRYNDQFHVMPGNPDQVAVRQADGSFIPLLVPQNPGSAVSGTNPLIPLTITDMKTAGNPRAAVFDGAGKITNTTSLRLNTVGVGTGVVGLPISQHQLGWVPPSGDPNSVLVRSAGDSSTGYAARVITLATSYELPKDSFLNGFRVGGNMSSQSQWRSYYYTNRAGVRSLFSQPDTLVFGAFVEYSFKITRKLKWTARLNCSNIFESRDVVIFPRVTPGSGSSPGDFVNARYTVNPRFFQITNTISF